MVYRFVFCSVSDDCTSRDEVPEARVSPLVLAGLATYILTAIERIISTGNILATTNYGENMARDLDASMEAHAEGGAGLIITQILSKIWYYPTMALGLGYAVVISKMFASRRWSALAIFLAQVPLLLVLGSGSRSAKIYPFLLAFVVADALAGPIRWWRALPLVYLGIQFFDLYGVFRGHQNKTFGDAIDATSQDINRMADVVMTEDAGMLTKEAYCVLVSQHGGREYQGLSYFGNQLIQILPGQIVPEKATVFNMSEFLSNELIGYGRYASGTAGAMVGDGLFMGGTIGVIVLSALLGLIFGLVVRWGMSPTNGRPMLLRYCLMLMISVQSTQNIRADLGVVLIQTLYWLVIPAVLMRIIFESGFLSNTLWVRTLEPYHLRRV
jgi:hypothetical protein